LGLQSFMFSGQFYSAFCHFTWQMLYYSFCFSLSMQSVCLTLIQLQVSVL
jgi:hypothetical protein